MKVKRVSIGYGEYEDLVLNDDDIVVGSIESVNNYGQIVRYFVDRNGNRI